MGCIFYVYHLIYKNMKVLLCFQACGYSSRFEARAKALQRDRVPFIERPVCVHVWCGGCVCVCGAVRCGAVCGVCVYVHVSLIFWDVFCSP